LAVASIGIGAEDLLRGGNFDKLVAEGVPEAGGVMGGDSSSGTWFISPVQPTKVWFHGVLSEDRYEKESKSAEVPRRGLSS
jgi:hypothetical protein